MKQRIYINDWLDFKPYEKQAVTDVYYLKICNKVKNAITTNTQSFALQEYLDKKDIDTLACFLTSYFEDLISETNIWNSFVASHKRLYNKQLPFYKLDEYYEEEINVQDTSFLIWYFINALEEDTFLSPYNEVIIVTGEKVTDVFEEAWEYAPMNASLKSIYQISENEGDFYVARNLIDTILFKTYLFHPDTLRKLKEQEIEIIEDKRDDENIMMFLNENRDQMLHKIHTRLLSMKGKEWASVILGNNHSLKKDFLNISQRIRGFFLYKGQDDDNIFIEHIASGKKFKLTKKSFDHSDTLRDEDTIIFMGIAQWKEEWWFSGVFFLHPFDPDLILDEKNSLQSRMAVNFLDHQKKETDEFLERQLAVFKNFNNDSQIAFMPSEKIDDFIKSYIEYFNNSLNLSDKEKDKAIQRTKDGGYFGEEKEPKDYSEVSDTGLVFFNPKSGTEIALSVNSAFPLPNNPFYNVDESDDDILFLLISDEMSTELAMHCISNCKDKLPFFKEGMGKRYLDDIDFLLRFWKKDNYFAKPAITYT